MENKKDKVALNDELLDKVSGGGVRYPDYEPDGSFFANVRILFVIVMGRRSV